MSAPVAGFWARIGAYVIDQTVIELAGGMVLFGSWSLVETRTSGTLTLVLAAALTLIVSGSIAYFCYFTATSGQTPGKRLVGITVVDDMGRVPSARQAVGRSLAATLFFLLTEVYVGLLDPLVLVLRRDRRAIHDLTSGTWVVRTGYPSRLRVVGMVLLAVVVLLALASALLLCGPAVLPHPYYIPSGAMKPTLTEGDRLIVDPLAYRRASPTAGDIVVFFAPPQATPDPRKRFVMRVVGASGDTIGIREGKLYRNGKAVEEPYILQPMKYEWPGELRSYLREPGDDPRAIEGDDITVPEGYLFVLGDNRNDSNDSSRWGTRLPGDRWVACPFLPERDLIGKAILIYWPPSRAGTIK